MFVVNIGLLHDPPVPISTQFTFTFPVPFVTRFISPFVCSLTIENVVAAALPKPTYAFLERFTSHS